MGELLRPDNKPKPGIMPVMLFDKESPQDNGGAV
jgi:hypothetical protein